MSIYNREPFQALQACDWEDSLFMWVGVTVKTLKYVEKNKNTLHC
jgi:hypothetical protein